MIFLFVFTVGCQQSSDPGLTSTVDTKASADGEGTAKQLNLLTKQVELLEEALASHTPKDTVEIWAKGVKSRNGALQFAMFSPELKKQERFKYENINWSTGVSSPWIEDYRIAEEKQLEDGLWEYEVSFTMASSMGKEKDQITKVLVKRYKDIWYIPALPQNSS